MKSQGADRTAVTYVPNSYTGERAVAVVLNFHGFGSNADQQMRYADFRSLAERETFVVVAPEGQGTPRHFNLTAPPAGQTDDTQFTLDLLDELERTLCVDRTRIYATGMSNGGAMTSVLACRASDRFAAFAAVAVVVWAPQCAGTGPVALSAYMGTADRVVPFAGGTVSCCGNPTIPPATESVANWAKHDGCSPKPDETRPRPSVRVLRYKDCPPGTAVEFHITEGGGHVWPPGATEEIWTFFSPRHR